MHTPSKSQGSPPLLPAKAYKAPNSTATHTPRSHQTQSSLSVEYRIYRGLHCLVIKILARAQALSTVALAFCSAKKGTTLFPPQGETLPQDRPSLVGTVSAGLRHQQTTAQPPMWPPCDPLRKNSEVTAPKLPEPPTPSPSSALRRTW